ncbi:hypothetical protein HY993_04020 [Candidatus Micrarchaeota archaeon]|nr:hypothetical protein [Candidatus Micrarchaeota archaeon]
MASSAHRREAKPLFVGLEHELESGDYAKALALIEKKVKPGMRVGLELSQERLDDSIKHPISHASNFFVRIGEKIQEKGGIIVPIDTDRDRLSYIVHFTQSMHFDPRRQNFFTEAERTAFNNASKLVALRSKHLLKKALKHGTEINFLGAQHAYEIRLFAKHIPLTVRLLSKYPQLKHAYRAMPRKDLRELAARFKTIRPKKELRLGLPTARNAFFSKALFSRWRP